MSAETQGAETRIAGIRARAEAATSGPWGAGRPDMSTIVDGAESKWIYAAGNEYIAAASGHDIGAWDEVMANARFIAHAREDVPWLLDRLAAVERERDEARRALLIAADEIGEAIDAERCGNFTAYEAFRDIRVTTDAMARAALAARPAETPEGR